MNFPFVSVIMPCYNEERYIKRSLDSIVANSYPKEYIEVLVIDGNSSDSTPDIVNAYAGRFNFIKYLINPERNTIAGLNLGIKEASGEIIVRVDAHTCIESDYIEQCVKALKQTDADNVGGAMRSTGDTYMQKAIALATGSIFGIGPGKFHYSDKEEYVDTVYLGAFRKSLFAKIGMFDPSMPYNEDNELNMRIKRNGGKILLSPKLRSFYYPRKSIMALWKQYYRYGYFKINVIKKHKLINSYRHFIPALFVLSLLVSAAGSLLLGFFLYIFYGVALAYLLASLFFSGAATRKHGLSYFPVLPLIFAVLHFSYGIGYLKGILDLIIFRKTFS